MGAASKGPLRNLWTKKKKKKHGGKYIELERRRECLNSGKQSSEVNQTSEAQLREKGRQGEGQNKIPLTSKSKRGAKQSHSGTMF